MAEFSNGLSGLYPAIIQSFGIIFLGYVSARTRLLTAEQGKGINFFASKFALPALLFSNMVVLDWSQVSSTSL